MHHNLLKFPKEYFILYNINFIKFEGLEARKCKTDGSWATEINRDGCKLKELEQLENVLNLRIFGVKVGS